MENANDFERALTGDAIKQQMSAAPSASRYVQ
jgi:hypothetical protein